MRTYHLKHTIQQCWVPVNEKFEEKIKEKDTWYRAIFIFTKSNLCTTHTLFLSVYIAAYERGRCTAAFFELWGY